MGNPAPLRACHGVVHVPKSGGSSLRDAFSKIEGCYAGPKYFDEAHFGTAALLNGVPPDHQGDIARRDELGAIVAQHRLVVGHYCTGSLLGAGCTDVSVQVREPRARLLSLYRYWQSNSAEDRVRWGTWGTELVAKADLALGDFLRTDLVWPATENQMARQVMGDGRRATSPEEHRATLEHFAAHVVGRLAVVEWSARSEAFFDRVSELIGESSPPSLERVNVTEVVGATQDIDSDTLELLVDRTSLDRALLDALMDNGALSRRGPDDLDAEFEATAVRLGFSLS